MLIEKFKPWWTLTSPRTSGTKFSMWEAIDKETVPPAALALQKQQQGGLLVVSGGCSLLNKAADWARSLPSTPDWLHPYAALPAMPWSGHLNPHQHWAPAHTGWKGGRRFFSTYNCWVSAVNLRKFSWPKDSTSSCHNLVRLPLSSLPAGDSISHTSSGGMWVTGCGR